MDELRKNANDEYSDYCSRYDDDENDDDYGYCEFYDDEHDDEDADGLEPENYPLDDYDRYHEESEYEKYISIREGYSYESDLLRIDISGSKEDIIAVIKSCFDLYDRVGFSIEEIDPDTDPELVVPSYIICSLEHEYAQVPSDDRKLLKKLKRAGIHDYMELIEALIRRRSLFSKGEYEELSCFIKITLQLDSFMRSAEEYKFRIPDCHTDEDIEAVLNWPLSAKSKSVYRLIDKYWLTEIMAFDIAPAKNARCTIEKLMAHDIKTYGQLMKATMRRSFDSVLSECDPMYRKDESKSSINGILSIFSPEFIREVSHRVHDDDNLEVL